LVIVVLYNSYKVEKIITNEVKQIVFDLRADLCGIASVDRFSLAPEGFRPRDIWRDCQSVLVFAKKLPTGSLFASSCIPYTYINRLITEEVEHLTLILSRRFESLGIPNVPIPTDDPSEYWESERSYARGILSLRHAGYLAGLGVLGKNTLLINDKLGNMIQIGALLLNIEFEADPLATYQACEEGCKICIQSCPQAALDGITVNQQACRPLSIYKNERGFVLKKCWECRKVCPNHAGINNGNNKMT
jgi:epoxyqueuosine reductase